MNANAVLGAAAGAAGRGARHPSVERVLDRLLADYPVHFPGASAPPMLVSLRVASRRLSDVARAELRVGPRVDAVYIKIHKHHRSTAERVLEKAGLEFTTLSRLHPRMRDIPRCGVARPIAFFPEERAVVTAEVRGENLYQAIKAGVRWWSPRATRERLAGWCEESGVWLRHFQEITGQGASAPVPADTLLEHLDRLLAAGGPVALPAGDRARVMDFCRGQLGQVREISFPVVGAHPDFQPDNVVVGAEGITVLDFTSFRHAPACSDVARFIAVLEFLPKNPLCDPRAIRRLAGAFLRGYGWQPSDLDAALAVYVVRYVLLAAASMAEIRASGPARPLIQWRVRRFLATWCRRFLATGGACVLRGAAR